MPLKSIEEVDAALAAGKIKTLGQLVEAWPQALFDLGLEDSPPERRQQGGTSISAGPTPPQR